MPSQLPGVIQDSHQVESIKMLSKNLAEVKKHFGTRESMCHNCAFRLDSGEVEDFASVPYDDIPAQLTQILENIDAAVEGEIPYKPFFCHQGMPTNDGGLSFQPENRDEDEMPIGYPVCAGWLNEVMLQTNDPRRSSLDKRFPSFFRVWDRVRKATGGHS
jgi:hypothetical protein